MFNEFKSIIFYLYYVFYYLKYIIKSFSFKIDIENMAGPLFSIAMIFFFNVIKYCLFLIINGIKFLLFLIFNIIKYSILACMKFLFEKFFELVKRKRTIIVVKNKKNILESNKIEPVQSGDTIKAKLSNTFFI